MIYLGHTPDAKAKIIQDFAKAHDLKKIVICSPAKFDFSLTGVDVPVQWVDWPQIIKYVVFNPLLQTIDQRTLVVVNECLRLKNRNDLTYNCMRHYINQAGHVMVFNWLPMIEDIEDFMILFDFDTKSKWKREKFNPELLPECQLRIIKRTPSFNDVVFSTSDATKAKYQAEKAKLIADIEEHSRDPSMLPRHLHLVAGKERLEHTDQFKSYLVRNNRISVPNPHRYKGDAYPEPCTIFEFPDAIRDLIDVSTINGQTHFDALVSDLPADQYYFVKYTEWAKEIGDAYASLSA